MALSEKGNMYKYPKNGKNSPIGFFFGPFWQDRLVRDQIDTTMAQNSPFSITFLPKLPKCPKREKQVGPFWHSQDIH